MNSISTLNINQLSLWIVEDNKVYRQNLTKLISSVDWIKSSREFETGEEVIIAIAEDTPPEILLLDLGLPGIDGINTLKQFKKISPLTKVLILTVQDDEEQIFRAISHGADGYLLKALSPDSIVQSINEVMNGGSPINAYIANKILTAFKKINKPTTNYGLTEREKEIIELLVQGVSRRKIAEQLFLSYHTIDFHIRNIYNKLQVHSLCDAVAKSIREHLV